VYTGPKKTPTTTPSTATGKTTPPPSSLCNNPKFDAITRMDDEELYAFRGKWSVDWTTDNYYLGLALIIRFDPFLTVRLKLLNYFCFGIFL
jgi:hypothetical protein